MEKVWGVDLKILDKNCVEVHVLNLRPDPETGKAVVCSKHLHRVKWNSFYVVSGIITIEEEGAPDTVVIAGQQVTLKPGVVHRFKVTEPAVVVELVYAEHISEDIERLDTGHVIA